MHPSSQLTRMIFWIFLLWIMTSGGAHRAFLLVAPSIWTHFPYRLDCYQRVTHLCSTNCLKLIFLTVVGLGAPLSRFLDGVLYKFSELMKAFKFVSASKHFFKR